MFYVVCTKQSTKDAFDAFLSVYTIAKWWMAVLCDGEGLGG